MDYRAIPDAAVKKKRIRINRVLSSKPSHVLRYI